MTDEADDDTVKAHVALAETLEESRAEDGHDKDRDERLQEVQSAVQRIIHEDVLAVIRQDGTGDREDDVLHHPDDHTSPEVFVDGQALECFADWYLSDLLARLDDDRLFTFREAEEQQQQGNDSPYAHDFDPGHLIVAKNLDERQCSRDGKDTAPRRQAHTRDGKHVTLFRGARHHRGQRAVRQVECRVADRRAEVVGHEQVCKLHSRGTMWYRIDEDDGNCEWYAHPENPRSRFAPF